VTVPIFSYHVYGGKLFMKQLAIFKIKEGKRDTWLSWCHELEARKDEVLLSLATENCTEEIWWMAGDFVVCTTEHTAEHVRDNTEISDQHRTKARECLELVAKSDMLFDFHLPN